MLSRADRERIARIEGKRDHFRGLAAAETDRKLKARYDADADRLERVARYRRTFPLSIWLCSVAVTITLLPWVFLNRAGQGTIGIVASILVGSLLVARQWRVRRRRAYQPDPDRSTAM